MLGQGITGSALILGPDCSQNQAMEDLLKSTLHQSPWGLWSYPQTPSIALSLRLYATITVPLAVIASCEKLIKTSCPHLVGLASVFHSGSA